MKRTAYMRRRVRRLIICFLRMSREQKLNLVLWISIFTAIFLVLLLSVVKIYTMMGNRRESGGNPVTQQEATVVETPVTEQVMAEPVTPRPKAVALTFDDGPSRENDPKILASLQKYGAHATFFVVGTRAKVDGDIMQQYVAAGCEIGNHSWNHANLKRSKWKRVKRQVNKTNRTIKKLVNGYQVKLLRPPYGAISKKMRKKLDIPMILWNLDTMDWKSRDSKKILKKVKKNVKDGDIILMHDIYDSTAEAVELVVPWLQEQGYDVLTVSELMARNEKKLEDGSAYLHGRVN